MRTVIEVARVNNCQRMDPPPRNPLRPSTIYRNADSMERGELHQPRVATVCCPKTDRKSGTTNWWWKKKRPVEDDDKIVANPIWHVFNEEHNRMVVRRDCKALEKLVDNNVTARNFDYDEAIKLARDIKRNLKQGQAKNKQKEAMEAISKRSIEWKKKVPKVSRYRCEKICKQICWGIGWTLVVAFFIGMVIIYPLTLCNIGFG